MRTNKFPCADFHDRVREQVIALDAFDQRRFVAV